LNSPIYALAKLLERSYKNVHTDTKLLEQHGLIVMDGDKITAPYDMIHVDVPLMQAT